MRLSLRIGVLTWLVLLASVVPGRTQSNEGGISTDIKNEKLVRQLWDELTEAWNRHDVAAMGKLWAIDGDHMEPDGTRAKGRDAVVKLFTKQHETVFRNTTLDMNIEDVWFHGGDIAIVDGNYELRGARMPDGTELPTRRGHLTAVLLNEAGGWWIAANRLMIPAQLPYKR